MTYSFPPPPVPTNVVPLGIFLAAVAATLFAVSHGWKKLSVGAVVAHVLFAPVLFLSALSTTYFHWFSESTGVAIVLIAPLVAGAAVMRTGSHATRQAARAICYTLGASVAALSLFWALVFPKVYGVGELRLRSDCRSNSVEIGRWISETDADDGRFPNSVDENDDSISWRVEFASQNSAAAFSCATFEQWSSKAAAGMTSFALPIGKETCFPDGIGIHRDAVTDGASQTIVLLEATGRRLRWDEPGDVNVDELPPGVNLPGSESGMSDGWLSSYHRGGAMTATADGRVRFISERTDIDILRALITPAGNDVLEQW